MKKVIYLLISFLWFLSYNTSLPQIYGKIFNKEEAYSKFGPAIETLLISKEVLNNYLKMTENVIMFKIVDNELIILGDNRKILQGNSGENYMDYIFNTFSKQLVEELLSRSNGHEIFVENRKEVFTISYGEFTVELSFPCPPYCE